MGDRLYRSRHDRMLAGVAGGLAEMWDADPALVRIIWALLVIFTGGIALLVYIVMAIVVPEEDDAYPAPSAAAATGHPTRSTLAGESAGAMPLADTGDPAQAASSARQAREDARAARRAARAERRGGMSPGIIFGGFLVLLGVFFLVREYLPQIDFDWFWPLILVLLGLLLVMSAMGRGPRSGGSA
jgi:phage shock protein PspC (stress-responsive transcriptional regulator)